VTVRCLMVNSGCQTFEEIQKVKEARKRTVRIRSTVFRRRLVAKGWGLRGAWAEKRIGDTRLVYSGIKQESVYVVVTLSAHRWLELPSCGTA
jgi:hypothetical protein